MVAGNAAVLVLIFSACFADVTDKAEKRQPASCRRRANIDRSLHAPHISQRDLKRDLPRLSDASKHRSSRSAKPYHDDHVGQSSDVTQNHRAASSPATTSILACILSSS